MTVGQRLREARERQKVTLHAIADKTNISVRFLDAIEKGQLEKLPGGIFTRGFIRSYAAQVGLDPDAMVAQLLADEPGQRDDDIDDGPASSGDGPSIGLWAGMAALILVAALAAVYLMRPAWLGVSARTTSPPVSDRVADAAVVTPAPALAEPPPPSAPLVAGATTDAPSVESPLSPLRLVVAPSSRCWVQVSADGQMRVAREVAPGERVTVDAAERLQITVGDAGAFAYELNGRPGKSLGATGRVARATILPTTIAQYQQP